MRFTDYLTIIVIAGIQLLAIVSPSFGHFQNYDEFIIRVDSLLAPEIEPEAPGAAVVVIEHGKPIYMCCFGLANLEHKVPISSETVFNLASVSKQFVAVTILMLEQQGKISLQDDVRQYFPELPDYATTITLNHLLHHTSGLWEFTKMFRYYGGFKPVDYASVDDIIALLKDQRQLLFEPGSQWQYCNTNYALLGNLVARVTGESIASWTQTHIFEPLRMKSTLFQENCFDVIPSLANCYRKTSDNYRRDPRNSDVLGPSYLYSSIDDMAIWLDNFRHHTVGGDSLIEKLFQENVLNDGSSHFYGYGLGVSESNGKTIIGHSGQTGAFKSMMKYVREDEVGIAILSNNRSIGVETLAGKILDLFYGQINRDGKETETNQEVSSQEPKPFLSIDSVDTEILGGVYSVGQSTRRIFISRLNTCMYGIFDGRGSDAFYPISETEFMNRSRNVSFAVYHNESNLPTRLMFNIKGDTMWADKEIHPTLTPDVLTRDYVGIYYCNGVDAAYTVALEGDKLVIRHRRYADRYLHAAAPDEFIGGIGIVRFSRNEMNEVDGFGIFDEDTNFKPLTFRKIK